MNINELNKQLAQAIHEVSDEEKDIEAILNEEWVEFPEGEFGVDLSSQTVRELSIYAADVRGNFIGISTDANGNSYYYKSRLESFNLDNLKGLPKRVKYLKIKNISIRKIANLLSYFEVVDTLYIKDSWINCTIPLNVKELHIYDTGIDISKVIYSCEKLFISSLSRTYGKSKPFTWPDRLKEVEFGDASIGEYTLEPINKSVKIHFYNGYYGYFGSDENKTKDHIRREAQVLNCIGFKGDASQITNHSNKCVFDPDSQTWIVASKPHAKSSASYTWQVSAFDLYPDDTFKTPRQAYMNAKKYLTDNDFKVGRFDGEQFVVIDKSDYDRVEYYGEVMEYEQE